MITDIAQVGTYPRHSLLHLAVASVAGHLEYGIDLHVIIHTCLIRTPYRRVPHLSQYVYELAPIGMYT